MSEEKVTVQDTLNYLMSKGVPVSGLAMVALMHGWSGETVLDVDHPFTDEVRAWKRRERRLLNRLKRWLRWQWFKFAEIMRRY